MKFRIFRNVKPIQTCFEGGKCDVKFKMWKKWIGFNFKEIFELSEGFVFYEKSEKKDEAI